MKGKKYYTNRFLVLAVTLMGFALIFSVDLGRLLVFYNDPVTIFLVLFFVLINPLVLLYGFRIKIPSDRVEYRHNLLLHKTFKIADISHLLYQPTWRAISSPGTATRSLHIVRNSGGWRETISLANGAFREEDLAEIARTLKRMNPGITLDEHTEALLAKNPA
jgi:hypothetical protein